MQPGGKTNISLGIGLIQPNIESGTKWNFYEKRKVLSRYKQLSMGIKNIDLLIWPESVLPGELFYDSALYSTLVEIAKLKKTRILLGSGNMSFKKIKGANFNKIKKIYYNSAYLIGKDGKIKEIYDKIILVPFGEYIPFKKFFPEASHLTPIEESFHPGNRLTLFYIEKDNKKIPFSAVICIEDIYPQFIRQFVKNGALFIVNLTNDGWFSNTPCAYQHFSMSILRAVENRRPMIRCANTGVSAIITPSGEVAKVISKKNMLTDIEGILREKILLDINPEQSFYTRYGDIFIIIAVLYTIVYCAQNKIYSLFRTMKRFNFRNDIIP